MSSDQVLTSEQARQFDRVAIDQLGMPGLVLMENAGRGLVDLMIRRGLDGPVLIACGPGNNGGDGFVMARHLDLLGIEVHVLLAADPARLRGDAADNLRWLCATGVHLYPPEMDWPSRWATNANGPAWIVDALLGTGAKGAPRGRVGTLIEQLNRLPAGCRLAVDIPSGLDGDTGEPAAPTFRADVTGTFVAAKPGLIVSAAAAYVGQLEIIPIGVPRGLLERFLGSQS